MTRRALLLTLTAALAGCADPRLLTLDPVDRLELAAEVPVRVALVAPRDARPAAEREGREPRATDRGVPFVGEVEVERGSRVSGDDDLGDVPMKGLTSTLRRYLRSIDGVHLVDTGDAHAAADADYVVEVEVLHLLAASFRSRRELEVPVVDWFLDPQVEERFLPVSNVVLRLRLRSRDGRFKAARVVNTSVLGGPGEAEEPGELVAGATRAAAHEARQLTASWLVRAGAAGVRAPAADAAGSFLVHAVDVNRTGLVVARVDRETGALLSIERRAGLPLVGPPGVWHLSPFGEDGVLLPPAEYDALSRDLSARFALQRADQLTVYRYLGPLGR